MSSGKQFERDYLVGVHVKNDCAAVVAIEHMIGIAGNLAARNAGHRASRH